MSVGISCKRQYDKPWFIPYGIWHILIRKSGYCLQGIVAVCTMRVQQPYLLCRRQLYLIRRPPWGVFWGLCFFALGSEWRFFCLFRKHCLRWSLSLDAWLWAIIFFADEIHTENSRSMWNKRLCRKCETKKRTCQTTCPQHSVPIMLFQLSQNVSKKYIHTSS